MLAENAIEHQAEKVIIADRWMGGLGKILLFILGEMGLVQSYPIIYVKNVKLRRDFERTRSQPAKSLTLRTNTEAPFEAQKLADVLSQFLNIPKQLVEESLAPSIDTIMYISIDQRRRIQITFQQAPQGIELGPRITVSHLIWKPHE